MRPPIDSPSVSRYAFAMPERIQRKLAAVMAADVVGYSRLMGDDEAGTLASLRQLRRELFGPAVAGRRGHVAKSMGDGWLVEFASAVDAVICAMQVQDRLAGHAVIKLRIGVHIGDIVHEEEDIFGDGVNITARLQEIASPGAVAVSDAVYGALDGTLRPSFDDQGTQTLKNIALPVRVWARGGDVAGASQLGAKRFGFPELSIVPVETSDGRPEVRELTNALTSDLVSYLGTTYWLKTDTTMSPAADTYIVRSVLRAMGDRLRLETTLTAPDGTRIWATKHDGRMANSFDWQDETSQDLATNIYGGILDREALVREEIPESELSAEQWFLRGIEFAELQDATSSRCCLDCLAQAIKLSPDWGYAYSCALAVLFATVSQGFSKQVAPYLARQEEWTARADALEPAVSPARAILAFSRLVRTGDREEVRAEMMALLRHLPFDPDILLFGGYLFLYVGEPDTGLDCLNRLRLFAMHTPYATGMLNGIAFGHLQRGEYEKAIEEADAALHISPDYPSAYRMRAAACAHLGRMSKAAEAVAVVERLVPGESISKLRTRSGYQDAPGIRRYFDGLRKAGMRE